MRPPPFAFDSRDIKSCLGFISALPITDAAAAQVLIPDFLSSLRHAPPPPSAYFQVLEMLRAPLAAIQDDVARGYADKPLPPNRAEDLSFQRVAALWKAMAQAYANVAQLDGTDPLDQGHLATLCQRCIHYAGLVVFEHYRARRAFAAGLWLDLHGYFATAEDWKLATAIVPEPLGVRSRTTTCAQTYASALLVDLANPYARTPREFSLIARWAQRFSVHTALAPAPEDEGCRGYGVDLMLDRGLQPVENLAGTPSARVFDTSRLSGEMQPLLANLKLGQATEDIGLDAGTPAAVASRLLLQLYRPWCLAAVPRRFQRFRNSGTLQCCHGVDAIHYFVKGNEFIQPDHVRVFSRTEMDTLSIFRSQVNPNQPLHQRAMQLGFGLESWDILDSSGNGFRLHRSAFGARLAYGQLFCLKAPGSDYFGLARVCWLMLEADGGLQAGLQLLPGKPEAVSIRPVGADVSRSHPYGRGFLLPAAPEFHEPPSVVTPPDWFQSDRLVEVYTDRPLTLRMTQPLAQGSDFERIAVAPA